MKLLARQWFGIQNEEPSSPHNCSAQTAESETHDPGDNESDMEQCLSLLIKDQRPFCSRPFLGCRSEDDVLLRAPSTGYSHESTETTCLGHDWPRLTHSSLLEACG